MFWRNTLSPSSRLKFKGELNNIALFKRLSYLLFPVAWTGSIPSPLLWVRVTTLLKAAYIAEPNPHSTHIDSEDGGSKFLENVGIHLQDCNMSQFRWPQSIWYQFQIITLPLYTKQLYFSQEHTH
jgi:hypothetical protein